MDRSSLDGLERAMAGRLLLPGSPAYDRARQTFNGMVDRRPAAIATCRTTDEVRDVVKAAGAAGLPVGVRGGGHGVAGHAMGDGALVVDLREMRSVTVDPERQRAVVDGGALWADVDGATTAHDLVTTGGTFGDTGVGGLTLTGGIGFLMGTCGLSCDNLVRAEVVTADGRVVIAGEGGDPELLWALRGGGGNFGVVTSLEFVLHPLGPLHVGRYTVPISSADATLDAVAGLMRDAPPELVVFAMGPTTELPPLEDGTPSGPATFMRVVAVYQGSLPDADAVLAPLAARADVSSVLESKTYAEVQSAVLPFGLRNYWKGHFLRDLDGPAIAAVVGGMRAAPGGFSFILLEAISGQARHEPPGGAAFGQRAARWNATALGIWTDPDHDADQIGWARGFAEALQPASLTGAGYGNYASADETDERVRASFGAERFARLAAVKRRYDPYNAFRFNLNVPPAV
ncbi:MAG: FAD-binding oxidoreductase [Candidatus Limnocylindrales bacterium]